jgi:hypothetical protein
MKIMSEIINYYNQFYIYFPDSGISGGGLNLFKDGITTSYYCCTTNISSETVLKAVINLGEKKEEIELVYKQIETVNMDLLKGVKAE